MKLNLLFVGTKFLYNEPLQEYVVRQAKKVCDYVASICFYKDGENSLFLDLEEMFKEEKNILIVASKQNFPMIGKLVCTITEDNLVLKDEILIPSKAILFEKSSYLIEYKGTKANILMLDEMQKMPSILFSEEKRGAVIQLFDEDESSAKVLLDTLSQTYDVKLELVTLIDGWIEVHIESKKHGNIKEFIHSVKQLLPKKIIPAANIMSYIIKRLENQKKTITFAESCTGGLLSYFLTQNNGASKIFNGSLITYSNEIKSTWLAVDKEILQEFGAVSKETVTQMSEGVMSVSEADYAISISGIAGDDGGTPQKPVGTVFIGVRSKRGDIYQQLLLKGDRNYVQYQSVLYAIKMLLLHDRESFF
ncbi:C-terminal domain of CinA type S [hydrothermal vent metagenome]|uniref:C-terminal domain of CinA type S n=1 Tax=hydrothermal vent metagenome TaxID=652676 RepID=A0A1W1BUB5_9ZZZZ